MSVHHIFIALLAINLTFGQKLSRVQDEWTFGWLGFVNTDGEVLPPNLFSKPERCDEKNETAYKCIAYLKSHNIGKIKTKINHHWISTQECIRKAVSKDKSILGFQLNRNEVVETLTVPFKDYFARTSNDYSTFAHVKYLPKKTGFSLPKLYSKVVYQIEKNRKPWNPVNKVDWFSDDSVIKSSCKIIGWRVSHPKGQIEKEFIPVSMPVKLMKAAFCRRYLEDIEDDELCIENINRRICNKEAEGAPILCDIGSVKNEIIGMARRVKKSADDLPIVVSKLYNAKYPFLRSNDAAKNNAVKSWILIISFVILKCIFA